jgi:hypothetical protein
MSKTVSLKLPFPVTINGQTFSGLVKVEKEIAEELSRIVEEFKRNGVALEQEVKKEVEKL